MSLIEIVEGDNLKYEFLPSIIHIGEQSETEEVRINITSSVGTITIFEKERPGRYVPMLSFIMKHIRAKQAPIITNWAETVSTTANQILKMNNYIQWEFTNELLTFYINKNQIHVVYFDTDIITSHNDISNIKLDLQDQIKTRIMGHINYKFDSDVLKLVQGYCALSDAIGF